MNNSVTLFANGQRYDLPDSEVANFRKTAEASNIPVEDGQSFRTKSGETYTIPSSQIEAFRAAAPDAESVRPFRFADNSTKYMTMPEVSKFLRSKEWREGDEYKADREERDRAVNAKMGEDGEMHSPAWAGVKGALKGAATGFWEGGNAAANKIAKAIPEIGVSLESALGNALNLGGNAPNAVGNWFLADAASGKAWLDAKLPDQAKDWVGYEDWSTKTADKFADVSAMAYKFAPAMASGGSTALVNTMFAGDGINAASQTFDNAIQSGFTMGEANKAAAASFLVNFYGAKLMTRAGGVADNIANPLLRLAGGAAGVGTTMGVQNAANRGIENVTSGRPFAEGMGEAFEEGNVEGLMFHGINAIPGAVIKTGDRMRESREAKEYRRDSLLEVARGEDGGEFLNALLSGEGLDAAVKARKSGVDVSRKVGERAGLPDNMSAAERNEIIDAIAKARGERAAQNAVKVDGFRSEALDAAIGELGGDGEAAQDIRARVISKLKNARELDDPFRREELVGEAFEEWNKEHPKEKTNETRNGAVEAPAQPKPPVETRAEGAEAVRPVEAPKAGGEAPGVVEKPTVGESKSVPKEELSTYVKNPHGEPQEFSVAVGEPKPGEWTSADSLVNDKTYEGKRYRLNLKKVWNPKEGFEGEDFSPEMLDHAANSLCDIMEKAGMKVNRENIVDNFRSADESFDIGVLIRSVGKENFETALRKLGYDGFMSLANEYHVTAFDGKAVVPVEGRAEPAAKPVEAAAEPKVGEDTPRPAEGVEAASRASDAKPAPDGKGKMVKPKAAESDYGVTMFEEPDVDGDGVWYVVKGGKRLPDRLMYKSREKAEAVLSEERAFRKAIMESPSATLADGKKIRLVKTDEGWVPYDENYIDLRRGLFKAAKTKAEAVKVAEKGVKWAKDVAEFDSAYKMFKEDFGLDEFNKKVGWGNENGEGWNESAALEHLRRFDLEKLKDMKERAKRFNLDYHNGRDKKIQTWFDKVISEKKAPVPDGKGKMVKKVSDRDYLSETADKLNYDEVIDTDTYSNKDMRSEYKARIGELTDEQAKELADARRKERAADKKLEELLKGDDDKAIEAAEQDWDKAVAELQSVESRLKITESDLIDRIEAKKAVGKPRWTKDQYEERKRLIAEGKPVKIAGFPDGEALAVKYGKGWVVIDVKSGLRINKGVERTRKEAIASAEEAIKNHTKHQIEAAIKMGRADFDAARAAYEPKPDGKGKMVKPKPTEPPKTTAPVVDETGKTAETPTSYTPSKELVEAKSRIEAMPTMNERQKSAKKKAQKDWLLSSIDDAIKSHGDTRTLEGKPYAEKFVDEYESLLRRRDATWDREKLKKIREQIKKAGETLNKGEMITFDVPDDGTYKIYNTPEALTLFKRQVQKRLSPTSLKEGTIAKAEKPLTQDVKELGIGTKVESSEPPAAPSNGKAKKPASDIQPQKPLGEPTKGEKSATIGDTIAELDPSEKPTKNNPLGQIVVPAEGSIAQSIDADIAADEAFAAKTKGRSQGSPPAPAPGSAANPNLDSGYEPKSLGAGVKSPVARQQIVDKFKELFGDTVAIRGKNTTNIGKNYAGHYEPDAGIIRSKDTASLRTIPHELGHHIDALTKRMLIPRPAAAKQELIALGRKLYGNRRPNGGYQAEGFAELLKYYLQGNDAGLQREAPEAYRWLTRTFAGRVPDTMAKIDAVRDMIDRFQNQSAEQAVRAIRAKDKSLGEKVVEEVAQLAKGLKPTQENWIDEGAFITKGMRASGIDRLFDWLASGKSGASAEMIDKVKNHPVFKWKLYNGKAGGKAFNSLNKGLFSLSGSRRYTYGDLGVPTAGHSASEVLPTFNDIFGKFSAKEMDEFQNYAIARVAKEAYLDRGLEFGLAAEEIAPVLRKHANNAKFRDALDRYTHYKHGVLHLLVDAGAMSQQQFEAIVTENPTYVKIARRRENAVDLFRDAMLKRKGKAVNKRTGSNRQIEDIFDAGLIDDERVIKAAFQADILRSLVDAGKRAEAAGGVEAGYSIGANWIHEVPNSQGEVKFAAEKLRKQVVDALRNAGATGANGETGGDLFDALFDQNATLSVFKEKASNGKSGLVSLYDESGKLHTYELPENNAEGWAKALMGFTDRTAPNVVEKWFQIATAATRSGATLLNPYFAARNLVRDSMHAAAVNDVGIFIPGVSSVEGLVHDWLNTNPKQIYDAMNLGMGTMLGEAKLASAHKANRYLMSRNWFEAQWRKGITKAVADVIGVTENASRIKAFKNAYDAMIKMGADHEAASIIAGCNALDITLDFQRGGGVARKINRAIPFFNAGIQGLEKFARAHGIVKPKEWSFQRSRTKIAARTIAQELATITLLAIASELYNRSDDDRRRKYGELPSYEKNNYISFGDMRIPVPYESGYVFASIPRAVFEELYDGREGAVAESVAMFRKTLPGLSLDDIAGLGPFLQVSANKDWRNITIVEEHIKKSRKVYDWYTPQTSEFSKRLSKALYQLCNKDNPPEWIAPAYLDTIFNGLTGNLYGRTVGAIGGAKEFDISRPHTYPLVGTFFRNPTTSRLANDFYRKRQSLTQGFGSRELTPEENGQRLAMDEVAKELAPLWEENRMLSSRRDLSTKERNDQIEANTFKALDAIRNFNDRDKASDRKSGIVAAAGALTASAEISKDVRSKNLAVLKGISYEEAAAALDAYGHERIHTPVRNSRGFKTGRMKTHQRWEGDTIKNRKKLLRRVMDENDD